MEKKDEKHPSGKRSALTMRTIFRCMMEDGYFPTYENTHIIFGFEDNLGIVEYEEDILSVRLFFSIEKETYDLFLKASNTSMSETFMVKPVLLDDMKSIMFSCEMICYTVREFRKFFPRSLELISEALFIHKKEMRQLIMEAEVADKTIPATDDITSMAGKSKSHKVVS